MTESYLLERVGDSLRAAGAMVALIATLLLGRDLVLYTTTWQRVTLVALGAAVVLVAGAARTLRDADAVTGRSTPVGGD